MCTKLYIPYTIPICKTKELIIWFTVNDNNMVNREVVHITTSFFSDLQPYRFMHHHIRLCLTSLVKRPLQRNRYECFSLVQILQCCLKIVRLSNEHIKRFRKPHTVMPMQRVPVLEFTTYHVQCQGDNSLEKVQKARFLQWEEMVNKVTYITFCEKLKEERANIFTCVSQTGWESLLYNFTLSSQDIPSIYINIT